MATKNRGKAGWVLSQRAPWGGTDRDLRWAMEREEFEVHYQPVIELKLDESDGFEALARRRRREGWYPPRSS